MNSPFSVFARPVRLASLRAAAVFALSSAALLAAEQAPATPPATADEVVELPRFEVKDSRLLPQPESWRYASIPGFEVLTTASESKTNLFLREFSRLQQVLTVLWPNLRQGTPDVPVSLVLCDRGNQFEEFIPVAQRETANSTNCLFYQNKEASAIVVDFAATQLFTGDVRMSDMKLEETEAPSESRLINNPLAGADAGPQTETKLIQAGVVRADPIRAFRRRYIEYLVTNASRGALPAWFKEGLLQIVMAVDYTKKTVEFGRIGDVGGLREDDFNWVLSESSILPMETLFAGEPPKEAGIPPYLWQKQCYAFVHYCLFGEKRRHASQALKYLQRLAKEAPSEALFKECFEMDYKEAELALRAYARHTDHTYGEFKAKGGPLYVDLPKLTLREATDSEVGRIKGEALRLSGQPEEARNFIIAPYIRGERDGDLLAVLGFAEKEAGQEQRARKFLEAAVKYKSTRGRAYVVLAEMRANEALAKAPGKKLSREDLDRVLPLLLSARGIPPLLPEIYEVASDAWQASSEKPTREEFNFMLQGALLFPARLQLVYRVALMAARSGYVREAQVLVEHGERYSPDVRGRALFSKIRQDYPALQQKLESPTPAQPQPAGAPSGGAKAAS